MAQAHIVDVKEAFLECMLCELPEIFIIDNTRAGKEAILEHLWTAHQFKGRIFGVS